MSGNERLAGYDINENIGNIDKFLGFKKDINSYDKEETKLSSEFQEIKSENFDKRNSMNIIDIEKLKIILKEKLIGQIHKYLVETNKLEYVSIEKLKAGETNGMEGKINSNLNEAVDEFIYKITNGIKMSKAGKYENKTDMLIAEHFLKGNIESNKAPNIENENK